MTGIIGWYVPGWMVEKYPDITDWNNLNKYADMFKTPESGGKGQFLGANPTFVQYDEALIANLGLNYKVIFLGSEAATIDRLPGWPTRTRPRCSATSTTRSGC